jgi:hypothetical protein
MMNVRYWCVVPLFAVTAGCGGGGGGGMAPAEPQANLSSPDISLTTSSGSIRPGESVTLQWSAARADSCTASGDWSGTRPVSGEYQTPPLAADQSFTLSCNGPRGGAVARVAVKIGDGSGSSDLQIRATPRGVAPNGSTTLSWEARSATSCTASGDWSGAKATSGSETISSITGDRTFRLNCIGANGNAVAMTTVTVREARLSWQAPSRNMDGSSLGSLAGYKIYWGPASGRYTQSLTIRDPSVTNHRIPLEPGTHFFAMRAVTSDGSESDYSNEISKQIL